MTNKTNVNSMEQLLEGLEFIGGWQWDVISAADLEIDELEYIKDYCSDLDEFAKKIEDNDYRIYEVSHHSYAELAETLEQEGVLDIEYTIKDNDHYFDYDQLDHDMSCGGDWSNMAWNEAEDIVNGHNDYINHLSDELQERIENHWKGEEDSQLIDDVSDYILENVYDDDYRSNYMEEMTSNADSEWLSRYFDYEAYGKDVVYDGQFYETERGFIEII